MLIRTRLALALVAILTVALTTFSVVIYEVMRSTLVSEIRHDVQQRADLLAVATAPAQGTTALRLPRLDAFKMPDTYIQIRSSSGVILASSGNLGKTRLPLVPEAVWGPGAKEVRVNGVPLVVRGRPIMIGGKLRAYVLVAEAPSAIYRLLTRLRDFLYPGTAVAVLFAGLAVWLLVWRSLRPLARVDASAADIAASRDHAGRVPLDTRSDEIGRLARSINSMLAALNGAYRQVESVSELQRRFLADVSHELRRPLTIMLSSLDLLRKMGAGDPAFQEQTLADMRVEVDRMARMVTQLLILARTDASASVAQEPVLLADVIAEACRQSPPAESHADLIATGVERLDGLVIPGNADYLKQLFLILLDNAFKYTRADGHVEVIVAPNGTMVDVTVADTGIGIPHDDMEHIFDRFYRAPEARHLPGMGLGLSIARHIVEQHRGAIGVESAPGTGSRFTVKLPLLTA